MAMLAAGLTGFGLGIIMPMIFSRLMQIVPGEESGTAMGLLNAAIFCGSFLNPVITMPLREVTGLSGLFFWLAVGTLSITLLAVTGRRLDLPARPA